MMSNEEKIWVDVVQPAMLIDGEKLVHCHTLGEAKMAWDRLPDDRKAAAKISSHNRVFAADELDRLYDGGPYEAQLIDAVDASIHDSKRMDGPDDDAAKAQARDWAMSHKIGKMAKLSLKQGSSRGILHEDIFLPM
jgi:hypothetical protein